MKRVLAAIAAAVTLAAPLLAQAQEAPRRAATMIASDGSTVIPHGSVAIDLGRIALKQAIDREDAASAHQWKLGSALWLGGLATVAVGATIASGGLVWLVPVAVGGVSAVVGMVKTHDSIVRLRRVVAAREALADPKGYDPLLVIDTLDGDEAAIAGDNARRDAQTAIDDLVDAVAPASATGNEGFHH